MKPYADALRNFKRSYFIEALRQVGGNQCKAAVEIGIHRNTMNRLIRECGLTQQDIRAALKAGKNPNRSTEKEDTHA